MSSISIRGIMQRIVGKALISAAAVLLFIAVWLAVTDQVAAGSLVAALFVVVALFHLLPQMESFKAFGVEAKWRERLREADEILRKLKASTLASAQLTYHTLGWGSRFAGETAKRKQQLADQVDAVLVDLGVERGELMALRRDYLFFAALDVFQFFDAIVGLRIRAVQHQTTQRLNELASNNDNPEFQELSERLERLRQPRPNLDLMEDLQTRDFRELCHSRVPMGALPARDVTALRTFADRVVEIVDTCRRTGRVSDEAAEMIDHHQTEDRKNAYRDLFKEEPIP